jgi:hypothetical protein
VLKVLGTDVGEPISFDDEDEPQPAVSGTSAEPAEDPA